MMEGDDQSPVSQPHYDGRAQAVRIGHDLVVSPVTAAAWAYQQGAYRVLPSFLEARGGRALTAEEFDDFRRSVAAVTLTIDRLPEIDELVVTAGEAAFSTTELGLEERALAA